MARNSNYHQKMLIAIRGAGAVRYTVIVIMNQSPQSFWPADNLQYINFIFYSSEQIIQTGFHS